jgi:hypothetical protein
VGGSAGLTDHTFRVEWFGETRTVRSCDQLQLLLRELDRQFAKKPAMVDIEAPSGAVLTVGLGSEASVLSFAADSERPPYYASHGMQSDDGTVWFDYQGSASEYPIWQVISISDALKAAAEFCRTGARPTGVRWESV